MTQLVLFVDDLGYDVQIGTEVGFTEETANRLPSDIGNGSYVVDKVCDDGYFFEIVMIRHNKDEEGYTRISPEIRITVSKDQIGCI